MSKTEKIDILTIRHLLSAGSEYMIPIYQRNYAWGADEIKQLIQDVIDYATLEDGKKHYYIGTLVVSKIDEKAPYETIDGQQRLTTLSILTAALRNITEVDLSFFADSNLFYESRERSSRSLQNIFQNNIGAEDMEENIIAAYEICREELPKQLASHNISVEQFTSYLYDFVKILRVPLPSDTDLNHYFEIMNSRGEQLEKHEVLKAQLMAVFNQCDQDDIAVLQTCFDLIWQSCSEMETYVQFGFNVDQRIIIFSPQNWDILTVNSFDEIVEKLRDKLDSGNYSEIESIDDILSGRPKKNSAEIATDSPDRFNSVINFQNFLLHVLRVQSDDDTVFLDDKRLLKIFDPYIKKDKQSSLVFVKEFAFNLLKCKMLFDKYIIKREFTGNSDRWSLKSLRHSVSAGKNTAYYAATFADEGGDTFNSDNRRILMLLSMFHVSNPSMTYKYWLYAALKYLFGQFEVESTNYVSYLEHIAKAFVYDKFLAEDSVPKEEKEYQHLICRKLHPISRNANALNFQKTNYHSIENNLVFNFVDYLLWLKYKNENIDPRIRTFEFSFRSSVEHYYPQTGFNKDIEKLEMDVLHAFGNLCLISNEKNSKLRNFTPSSKKEYYAKDSAIDSLKQFLMMRERNWTDKQILAYSNEMRLLLQEHMDSHYLPIQDVSKGARWFKQYRIIDQNLLARTFLCFGDTSRNVNNSKYNFRDFEYIKKEDEYLLFEEYIQKHSPLTLQEIIEVKLLEEDLRHSWRYPFIKFPDIMNYCSEGNFLRENDDRVITLLKSIKRGKENFRPLYNVIIQKYLSEVFQVNIWSDSDTLYLDIDYQAGEYKVVSTGNEEYFSLGIWEDAGESIKVQLHSKVNGNHAASKRLPDLGWEKINSKTFTRREGETLCKLSDNVYYNIATIESKIKKLLKVGFGIITHKNN